MHLGPMDVLIRSLEAPFELATVVGGQHIGCGLGVAVAAKLLCQFGRQTRVHAMASGIGALKIQA